MKSVLVVLLLFIAAPADAGPYVEGGVGFALGDTCIISGTKDACYDKNPYGVIGLGYTWKNVDFKLEHWSSFEAPDRGGEIISVRYRYEFGGKK